MDEFALHKGHRYATVVVDPIGRQVLQIGPGRSRKNHAWQQGLQQARQSGIAASETVSQRLQGH